MNKRAATIICRLTTIMHDFALENAQVNIIIIAFSLTLESSISSPFLFLFLKKGLYRGQIFFKSLQVENELAMSGFEKAFYLSCVYSNVRRWDAAFFLHFVSIVAKVFKSRLFSSVVTKVLIWMDHPEFLVLLALLSGETWKRFHLSLITLSVKNDLFHLSDRNLLDFMEKKD